MKPQIGKKAEETILQHLQDALVTHYAHRANNGPEQAEIEARGKWRALLDLANSLGIEGDKIRATFSQAEQIAIEQGFLRIGINR